MLPRQTWSHCLIGLNVTTVRISVKLCFTSLFVVADDLRMRGIYKYDLVESLPQIQIPTSSTPTCHTYFHIQITIAILWKMTSVYYVSAVQLDTLTPYFQSVFRHQTSTLISSKSALTLASEERLTMVCFTSYILCIHHTSVRLSVRLLFVQSMLVGWCGGDICRATEFRFTGHGFGSWLGTIAYPPWASYLHLCASVTKQYSNSIYAKLTKKQTKIIKNFVSRTVLLILCLHFNRLLLFVNSQWMTKLSALTLGVPWSVLVGK